MPKISILRVPSLLTVSSIMSTQGEQVGRVVRTGSETWQWDIPGILSLPPKTGIWFKSPGLYLFPSIWQLHIFPNGVSDDLRKIYLRLVRLDMGTDIFHCTLGIKQANGVEVTLPTQIWKSQWQPMLAIWEFYKCAAQCKEKEFLSSGHFTICLRIQGEAALQGRTFVFTETETDVLNTVKEEENENGQDRYTSPDAKGVAQLSKHIGDLLTEGKDYDVKIMVKDKIFQAHRNILKARSPIFSMMLSHDCKESTSGDIQIDDCDPETFEDFLQFVYSGRTENLTPSKALSLYYAGDKYDFPVLREQCVSFMKSSLSTSYVCDVVHLAARHREQDLLEAATSFFTQHMKEIILTVEWQKFLSMHSTEANELLIKSLRTYHLDTPFNKN